MQTIQIQFAGNLTHDVELQFTASGQAVANVRLANTYRRQDSQTKQWVDGGTTFLAGAVWGQMAEHAAESLQRGDRVVVIGTLRTEEFADKTTGEMRTVQRIAIDEIGTSLKFATAKPVKAQRQQAPTPDVDEIARQFGGTTSVISDEHAPAY